MNTNQAARLTAAQKKKKKETLTLISNSDAVAISSFTAQNKLG